jgi:fructose-1,6-bisphosphatase II
MDKIAGPQSLKNEISLEGSTEYNIESASAGLDKSISDLNVVVMDRPRHKKLISDLNQIGVNIHLIGDGDIAASLNAADENSEIDLLMGKLLIFFI